MNMNSHILMVYYSRKGENYVKGKIVNLAKGNTAVVAGKIQKLIPCELFEIETVKLYPEDYHETTKVAQKELEQNYLPPLKANIGDMDRFDTIIIGYPNWWGTFPMAVATFLKEYVFTGKTIMPLCTHEGSGLGTSVDHMKTLCPTALVKPGLAIRGSAVSSSDALLESWLKKSLESGL